MKDNVDLTLNRVFRTPVNIVIGGNLLKSKKMYPWVKRNKKLIKTREDLESKKIELMFTGTKKEREHKRLNREYEELSIYRCDCCGKSINQYPWVNYDTLCKECNESLEKEVRGFLWNYRLR